MTFTWYISAPTIGCFSLGTTTTVFPREMAGNIKETKAKSGNSSGHAMPTTPTASLTLIVVPYQLVSCKEEKYIKHFTTDRAVL